MSQRPTRQPITRARGAVAIMVAVAGLAAMVAVATASSNAASWLRDNHARRIIVEVDAGAIARLDEVIEVPVDLTRVDGDLDPASVVVIEVDTDDDELGEVPVQMENLATPDAATVVFAAPGTSTANSTRRFHVYFALDDEGVAGWSGTPLVTVANGTDEGQAVWRIENLTGELSYVRDGGAFSSYDDLTGDDWIGYNVRDLDETGGASDFRGVPNAVFDQLGDNDYFHPAHATSTSSLVVNGPVRVLIRSEANGADWVSEWTIGPRSSTFEMVEADTAPWWFLYEGPPGGTLELASDSWITADGTESDLTAVASNADLPDPEWIAYRDGLDDRSMLVVSHDDDTVSDRRTIQNNAMVVFGFGRMYAVPLFTGPGRTMSIELVEGRTFAGLGERAEAHRSSPVVVVAAVETRPVATTTTTTTQPAPTTTTAPPTPDVEEPEARPYRLLDRTGRVYSFPNDPTDPGGAPGKFLADAVDILATPSGQGYWILDAQGSVESIGDAVFLGELDPASLVPGETAATLSGTPDGAGYWIATTRGRVEAFGTAEPLEDLVDLGVADSLVGPIVDSVSTPLGDGFYLIGSDGGVFSLGNAPFLGSMGGTTLNAPVGAIVTDPDGTGYWLVAADGGVFAFAAEFRGSMGGRVMNAPVVGMVPYGNGYLMVGSDGGVFAFSELPFLGSLGGESLTDPVVAIGA